jgi:transcription termination factor Rho
MKAGKSPVTACSRSPGRVRFPAQPEANYLPGPDDIYVSPDMIRQHSLRTGDTVEGVIVAPRENERYFALTNVTKINFEEPTRAKHKVAFDNLTPLYPDERLKMEIEDPTIKDRSARIIDLVSPIGKGQRALDRGAAADRQDGSVAEHRAFDRDQSPRMLPDRPADRRTPEEVTDMQRSVKGEVISSTFDEPATRHVRCPKW